MQSWLPPKWTSDKVDRQNKKYNKGQIITADHPEFSFECIFLYGLLNNIKHHVK